MKENLKTDKKYLKDLRTYIATISFGTILFSFLICLIIGLVIMKIFYKGEVTTSVVIIFCLVVYLLSMIASACLIWIGAKHLTKPLVEITNVTKKVSEGNFKVRVKRKEKEYDGYLYTNEVDELARNINKMVEELDGMDYMRKDFMSNVSHEIKTPIAAISGFSEILLDKVVCEEKQREYLKLINNESIRVSRLCEYMLNMSRLDSQVIVINKEEIRLDEQIRKSVILLCEKWADYEIDFDINLSKINIKSDPDMLHQVWINIIDNAIKYSGKNCKINIIAKEVNNETIEIKVIDNGIGISKDKINKIFDKFYQCDESHKKSGSGLGLSITKRIIELLNGSINYESIEGIGTTVTITLPKYL